MSDGARGRLIALAAILAAILALGWWVFDGSTTWPRTIRSRLTIVVETPEGERSGSSVTQGTTIFTGGMTKDLGFGIRGKLVGEGVAVDLGPRGFLVATFETQFALSRGGMASYNPALVPFPQAKFRGNYYKGMSDNDELAAYLDEVNRLKPRGELPFQDLPVLVRFHDPKDPTSVELVDPQNLAASFGPGVTLKHAFVEITDDPVTKGIESQLPWLTSSNVSPSLFPPHQGLRSNAETPAVENLRYDDFRRLP